jgi:predicted glycoside hydrolase/deacetylase ChbG (UPF0249 family)
VHLNLTEGEPLAPRGEVAAILDGQGRLHRSPTVLFRALRTSPAAMAAAERELEAQILRARECGLEASHLDSHKHVHLYPRLLPVVIGLARKHGLRAMRTTPEFRPSGLAKFLPAEWGLAERFRQSINTIVLRRWGLAAQDEVRRAGLVTTDWFFGVRATGGISPELLEHFLRSAPEGTGELMTHPGLPEPAPARPTRLGESRPRELAALCDARVRRAAADGGWTWASFKDLLS